jgi:nicotinamidase-related amidase
VIFTQQDGEPGSVVEPFAAGWEVSDALKPLVGDVVFRKRSADAFAGTELPSILKAANATGIVLAGYASDLMHHEHRSQRAQVVLP